MGYWQEKKRYEEGSDKDFCSVCGRSLNSRNIKGKCMECHEVVCNNCGKVEEGKIICSDCKEGKIKWEGKGFFGKLFRAVRVEAGTASKSIMKAERNLKRIIQKK